MNAKFVLFPLLTTLAAASSIAVVARAAEPAPTILLPGDIKWGDAPSNMPPGAKIAVLSGDPSQPGPYTIRLKFPKNYKIPAHWHPTDENISVISGTFMVGIGDKFDASKTKPLPPGTFIIAPAKLEHFAMTKKETVVQITSTGPFELNLSNHANEPAPPPTPAK